MSALPDIDLSAIPEDQRDAVAALMRETASLKEINKRLEHLVAELNHVVHGKKSEKLDEDERQLAFEDLQIAVSEAEEQKQDQAPGDDTPKRKRLARRNRGNLPTDLPRIEQIVEPEMLVCPCGCGQMHKIGEDRTERLDIVPAQLRVIVTVRPKYACRACADGVKQAPAPAVRQTPQASTLSRTSPGPGLESGRSRATSGAFCFSRTIARMASNPFGGNRTLPHECQIRFTEQRPAAPISLSNGYSCIDCR